MIIARPSQQKSNTPPHAQLEQKLAQEVLNLFRQCSAQTNEQLLVA